MFSLEQFQMTVAVSVALCNYAVPSTPSTSHPQWSDAHVLSALREGDVTGRMRSKHEKKLI